MHLVSFKQGEFFRANHTIKYRCKKCGKEMLQKEIWLRDEQDDKREKSADKSGTEIQVPEVQKE